MESDPKERFIDFFNHQKREMNFYEKNICFIIYNNFAEILNLSYHSGKRSDYIISNILKIRDNLVKIKIPKNKETDETEIRQLYSLSVESFRGFSSRSDFILGKKYNFCYGRNGTGKSSFSEAIEYSLLGDIEESKAKRIKLSDYVKNIYTNKFINPILKGKDKNDNVVNVEPNNSKYHFCILERNRIENFARISAETDSMQQERLAALVGMTDWNDFVRDFAKELKSRMPFKNLDFKKRWQLYNSINELNSSLVEEKLTLDRLNNNKNIFLNKFKKSTLEEILKSLDKDIQNAQKDLAGSSNKKIISAQEIKNIKKYSESLNKIETKISEHQKNKRYLDDYKKELSLGQLFQTILDCQSKNPDTCPACLSPIYNEKGKLLLKEDPYNRASHGKQKLDRALDIEKKKDIFEQNFSYIIQNVVTKGEAIATSIENFDNKFNNSFRRFVSLIDELRDDEKTLLLFLQEIDGDDFTNNILNRISIYNSEKSDPNSSFEAKNQELNNLHKLKEDASSLYQKICFSNNKISELNSKERSLENSFFKFTLEQDKNQAYNTILENYNSAYVSILEKLKDYTNKVPVQELSDLDDLTCRIYNKLCENDDDSEKLESLSIPKTPKENIKITLVESKECVNALEILSEGHIRVLGLAILLAKAYKDKLKFIIFDDVVNAIDDDHRRAIADFVTDSEGLLSDLQWVITTHGPEFEKMLIQNLSNASSQKNANEIKFLPKKGLDIYTLNFKGHYLDQAKRYLDNDDMRNCLSNSRKEVEVLMDKAWKLFYKRYNQNLSFEVNPTNPIINTRNAINVLEKGFKSKFRGIEEATDAVKNEKKAIDPVINKFEELTQSVFWDYLNKGTHEGEEIPEFDRADAKTLLSEILGPLDEELNSSIKVKNGQFLHLPLPLVDKIMH